MLLRSFFVPDLVVQLNIQNTCVYINLQMRSFCPSERNGVRTKVQLWGFWIKNWVSSEIFMFSKYIVSSTCFVKHQAELSFSFIGASQKARIARSNKRFIRQQKLIPLWDKTEERTAELWAQHMKRRLPSSCCFWPCGYFSKGHL